MRLTEAVSRYVETRRLNGLPFLSSEITLWSFCKHCGDIDLAEVTSDQVSTFSNNPRCAPVTRVSKFSAVKCFTDFYYVRGQLPRLALLKPAKPREARAPFIYTQKEVHGLLKATQVCQAKALDLDAKTFRLLLLFLYATGVTVSEALTLRWSSVKLRKRIIIVGTNRSKPSRSLPIGADLANVLEGHFRTVRWNERDAFVLQGTDGGPLKTKNLMARFRRLRALVRLGKNKNGRMPRLQDFRYTFAVHRLNLWIQRSEDLNRLLPALSTYMGYAGLTTAEQFLAFVPDRFKPDLEKLSPAKGSRAWSADATLMNFLSSL